MFLISNYSRRKQSKQEKVLAYFMSYCFLILSALLLKTTLAYANQAGLHHFKTEGNLINVKVTINKSETVRLDSAFKEVLVGNSEIADVMPLTDKSIYVLGRQIGTTRLAILDSAKNIMGLVDVEVTYDLDSLRKTLKSEVPLADIKVKSINGKLLLTGVVPDTPSLKRVMTLAKQIAAAEDSITNAIRVASPQQVMLEVRFVEATRRAVRELGISWGALTNRFGASTGSNLLPLPVDPTTTATFISSLISGTPYGAASIAIGGGSAAVDALIEALEKRDLVRRLAEPNLVALSGDTANFLAGGEFPFPVDGGDDKITIEFKKFGVGLDFTPTVLSDNQINLRISPEVSELDPTQSLTINGTTVPGLSVRRATTTVELRDGQSFAIAGLLQADNTRLRNQLPWIGQVPVLGTLFRSASYQKRETDLVIIVTPRLVKPKKPGERLITPLDRRLASNDFDFFINGNSEIPIKEDNDKGHILRLKDKPAAHSSAQGAYDDLK